MSRIKINAVLVLLCIIMLNVGDAWCMDEAEFIPTNKAAVVNEDKQFNDAMSIWFKHKYKDGAKLLREFSEKNPNSRWAAEADLHVGCYLTYLNHLGEARTIFDKLIEKHPNHIVATKAKIRLGNVAERAGRFDEAISHYTNSLAMNPTWDQFRYANYRARKLIMAKGKLQARINCGPVALAACLDSLGKQSEAAGARNLQAGIDGMSLAQLKDEADKLGVRVQPVMMSLEDIKKTALPLLAHVNPNHYIAVTAIEANTAQLEDSISGKHEMSLEALEKVWSGIVLSFNPDIDAPPVAMAVAKETWGGCCGQADDDECLGDCPDECQQFFSSGDRSGGCGGPGSPCAYAAGAPPSGGSPTWKVNVINLNLLVKDTPIWYNPGKGPQIAFTLTYSNENSNTGIFGRGWRSPYDMKVFFLPSNYPSYPSLQVHRDNGRIETYEWYGNQYLGRASMRSYGYRDTIEKQQDGTVVLSLKGGGKYYFMPEGTAAEGRIRYIEDQAGNRVTCEYDSQTGNLVAVKDANNRVTEIDTDGSGITERVTKVTIPDGRFALFGYSNGYLTSITDMGTLANPGQTSTLTYDALAWGNEITAYLTQSITASPLFPENGGSLGVNQYVDPFWAGTDGFPSSGTLKIINSSQEEEFVTYTSKATDRFYGITRGATPIDAAIGSTVRSCGGSTVPYLNTIETPSRKTMFTYEWWTFDGLDRPIAALHEVYECAPGQNYPEVPTIHYAWCSAAFSYGQPQYTNETRYPTSVTPGGSGCTVHWTGGLTRKYKVYQTTEDAIGSVVDVIDGVDQPPTVVYEEYDWNRNRTKVKDGNGNLTTFTYDSNRNMTSRKPPFGGTWSYEYVNNHPHVEKDPANNKVKIYTYNGVGQITKIETELTPGVRSTLVENYYYPGGSNPYKVAGQLDYTVDGRGKITNYYYNQNSETRGFLTSVEDPEGHKTWYQYDEKGRRNKVTDANDNTTEYEYDNLDRIVKIINPDNTTVEMHYTCCQREWVKDENGKVTKYEYDKRNRLWLTIRAAIGTTLAQAINDTDTQIPLSSVTDLTSSGSLLLKAPNGDAEIVTYSGINGNVLTGVTRARFGTAARAFTSADATAGNMTVDVYDEDILDGNGNYIHRGILDRKIGLYDPNGNLTQYEYYANNRLKKTIYPDGTWEHYTYDPAGNMTKKEYGHAAIPTKTINYVYDANNRLVSTYGQ